jgi:hypothetical protein
MLVGNGAQLVAQDHRALDYGVRNGAGGLTVVVLRHAGTQPIRQADAAV